MTAANELGLADAVSRIRTGELGVTELLAACLDRVAAREPEVGAWEYVAEASARAGAAGRERDGAAGGPLGGIPVAVKDIVDVAGMPTGCGSPVRAGRVADVDAWCVRRLREAGALVLGKTVTTEFAYFSPGRTRNPHAPEHTPGGSSSGSAAAVADLMAPCAIGTQTAGSTVRPASFCGIAGLVPSFGRIPLAGVQHLAPTLDRLGLFATTVDDMWPLYRALVDGDAAARPLRPWRVLVADGSAVGEVHPGMRDTVRLVADTIADQGVQVEPLGAEDLQRRCGEAQRTVMAYEAARTLRDVVAEHRNQLSTALLDLVDAGAATPDRAFLAALEAAAAARHTLDPTLADGAVILAPAAPGPAPRGLDSTGDPAMNRPWHLLGLPELALPAGASDGLPLGVQLVGAFGGDERLLAVATWLSGVIGTTR